MVKEIVSTSLNFVSNTVNGVLGYFSNKREQELREQALEYQHTENMTGANNASNILAYGQSKSRANAVSNGVIGVIALIGGGVLLYKLLKG